MNRWMRAMLASAMVAGVSVHSEETEVTPIHWRLAPERGFPAAEAAPAADPAGYQDPDGFRARGETIVRGLGQEDLAKWRRGYFRGGDPGKYLPSAAMARLMLNPDDAMARQYLNDDRAPTQHYHFAVLNWARLLPLFGDVLTPETLATFRRHAARTDAYRTGPGTENHKLMWRGAGLALPDHIPEIERFAGQPVDQAKAGFKDWLRGYVRDIYVHGMGEWESATYHMFCVHSIINAYDFAADDEVRLLAAALLEYYVGAYALKYTDGILSGPSQRGMASQPMRSITDQSGWLWWGATQTVTPRQARNWRYAMVPATSAWRPSPVLGNIARRQLPDLPFTVRAGKANYWYGQGIQPRANDRQETLYVDAAYTLGSLWSGYDVHGQTVRWQFTAAGSEREPGAVTLTGGHPWDNRSGDGLGKYEQTAQIDGTFVLMANIPTADDLVAPATRAFEHALANGRVVRTLEPDPEAGGHPKLVLTTETVAAEERESWIAEWVAAEAARCPALIYLDLPEQQAPLQHAGWFLWRVRDAYVAVYPLGGTGTLGELPPSAKAIKRAERNGSVALGTPVWQVQGQQVGFVMHTAARDSYPSLGAFAAALAERPLSGDAFSEDGLQFTTPNDRQVSVRWNHTDYRSATTVDGEPVTFDNWPVFESPYLTLRDGVLSVHDGSQGYQVDATGDLPVYRAWMLSAAE